MMSRMTPHVFRNFVIIGIFAACLVAASIRPSSPGFGWLAKQPEQIASAGLPEINFPLSGQQIAAGWIALFDGESLFGWKAESNANWRVHEGEIMADQGDVGLLRTTSQFSNFELVLEFHASEATNSGVFIHTSPRPTDPAVDCYEINIAPPTNPFPTGSIVARSRGEATIKPKGKYHHLRIVASGNQILVEVNHEPVVRYRDARPLGRGYIGLQYNSGAIRFRKVCLRPLKLTTLFDGQDLSRWNTYSEMDGRFAIANEGDLHVTGGPGQLETKSQYADFVLQLQSKTIGPNQNSGVFFRCIPGQKMNGYEVQIDHATIEADRDRPANFGTGGIFRRQPARRVVSNDDRWFHMTLAASGPHFSVWINGFQVLDWTDTRRPDENPRRGQRLKAGTIMLQAHDPQTNVWFRDIRAGELAPRGR